MKFGLLLPTRKRPQQLKQLIESIILTTHKIKDIEIHLAVDNDDRQIQDIGVVLKDQHKYCNLFIHMRPRGNSIVTHYYNWLALNFSTSEYLMILNDDTLFRSQDWDKNVYNRLEEYLEDKPDRLVLGISEDLDSDREVHSDYLVSGFPIISKECVETLGFLLDPSFMMATSDDDICKLYATINRVVDLRDILVIQHHPPEFKDLDKKYAWFQEPIYDEIMEIPILPQTVAEMRFFLDKRISILIQRMLKVRI